MDMTDFRPQKTAPLPLPPPEDGEEGRRDRSREAQGLFHSLLLLYFINSSWGGGRNFTENGLTAPKHSRHLGRAKSKSIS